jgi:hypothetical protein
MDIIYAHFQLGDLVLIHVLDEILKPDLEEVLIQELRAIFNRGPVFVCVLVDQIFVSY